MAHSPSTDSAGPTGSAPKAGSLTAAEVAEALDERFGSGFHNPRMNGYFWRAVRKVLGLPEYGTRLEPEVGLRAIPDLKAFLDAVQRIVCPNWLVA